MDKSVTIDVYHGNDKQQVIDLILGIQREEFNTAIEKNGFTEISKDKLPEAFPVMEVDSKFYTRGL